MRASFIQSTRSLKGLELQLDEALQDIKSTLCIQAQIAGAPSRDKLIRVISGGVQSTRFLPLENRIIELPLHDILLNYPQYSRGIRGLFDYKDGKIFICEGEWCREAILHEALHSVSFLCVRPDLRRRLLNLDNGLTEFFTGYVLYQRYKYCYSAWRESLFPVCSVIYTAWVKLWGILCRFIPISELKKIYFWDGITRWETLYADFLSVIHQTGYPKFQDILRMPKKLPLEVHFYQECRKNFGKKKFDALYGSTQKSLDYGQMLP